VCLHGWQSDDYFVPDLAVESRADFLVTFNTKDFAGADHFGVRAILPRLQ
jgi:predicted nucleic acid-binding protein